MTTVRAPVRICDLGGWTDTWFGGPGRVLNMAVGPGVEVTLDEYDGPPGRVRLELTSFGESYLITPGGPREARHPLIEAAVDLYPPGPAAAYRMTIRSHVPPGCGAGTSAAVTVAAISVLSDATGLGLEAEQIAYAAHRVESDVLGGQSGIQDQLASALGGINYLQIEEYPRAIVERLPDWPGLGELLSLVYLGRAHSSTVVHEQVMADVRGTRHGALQQLRDAAGAARSAVLDQDVEALGRALLANSQGQSQLHPSLIGTDARKVVTLASGSGAAGWKVNGAGGEGGSLTVLHRAGEDKEAFADRLAAIEPSYQVIPVSLCSSGAVADRR